MWSGIELKVERGLCPLVDFKKLMIMMIMILDL